MCAGRGKPVAAGHSSPGSPGVPVRVRFRPACSWSAFQASRGAAPAAAFPGADGFRQSPAPQHGWSKPPFGVFTFCLVLMFGSPAVSCPVEEPSC